MWVSWWTERSLGRIFWGFPPFSPTTNFILSYLHTHLIHFISFHFICPCYGASGGVGRHPCYLHTFNKRASSHLTPRSGPMSDTSWGYFTFVDICIFEDASEYRWLHSCLAIHKSQRPLSEGVYEFSLSIVNCLDKVCKRAMGGSPGDVKCLWRRWSTRRKGWRMRCDVGEATEGDGRVGEWHSAHSPPLPSRCFNYVIWRAAHWEK